jgi:hypothetical protein
MNKWERLQNIVMIVLTPIGAVFFVIMCLGVALAMVGAYSLGWLQELVSNIQEPTKQIPVEVKKDDQREKEEQVNS